MKFFKQKHGIILLLALFAVVTLVVPHVAQAGLGAAIVGSIIGSAQALVNMFLSAIFSIIIAILGVGLYLIELVFDLSIWLSILKFGEYAQMDGIMLGWTLVRDVCNIFFIFILLYIALSTIVQANVTNAKSLLVKVIIAALLINFSMPIARAVIDASNVIALLFYNQITEQTPGSYNPLNKSIAGRLVKGLSFDSMTKAHGFAESVGKFADATTFGIILNYILSIILMVAMACVLIIAAILFFIRMITLLFLLVVSPFAFIGSILPRFEHMAQEWWSGLFKRAFFAPIFLFFLYITIRIIEGSSAVSNTSGEGSLRQGVFSQLGGAGGTEDYGWGDVAVHGANLLIFPGGSGVGGMFDMAGNTAILAYFAIVFGFLFGSIIAASKLSVEGAKFATEQGKNLGGFIGSHTVGRAAQGIRNSDWYRLQHLTAKEGSFKQWALHYGAHPALNKVAQYGFGGKEGYEGRVKADELAHEKQTRQLTRYQSGDKMGKHPKAPGGMRVRTIEARKMDRRSRAAMKYRLKRLDEDVISMLESTHEGIGALKHRVPGYTVPIDGESAREQGLPDEHTAKTIMSEVKTIIDNFNANERNAGHEIHGLLKAVLAATGRDADGNVIYETVEDFNDIVEREVDGRTVKGFYHVVGAGGIKDYYGDESTRDSSGRRYAIDPFDGSKRYEGQKVFYPGEVKLEWNFNKLDPSAHKDVIRQLKDFIRTVQHDVKGDIDARVNLDQAGGGGGDQDSDSDD